jgi:hypothetical protein
MDVCALIAATDSGTGAGPGAAPAAEENANSHSEAVGIDVAGLVREPGGIDINTLVAGGCISEHRTSGTPAAAVHARMMRTAKQLKRTHMKRNVSPFVQGLIDTHNAFTATRPSEQITVLSAKRGMRIRGTGRYKHWTPVAALRACFAAVRPRLHSRRKVRQRILNKRRWRHAGGPNPAAQSMRSVAQRNAASTTYVRKVRNAMSQHIVTRQSEQLRSMPSTKHVIFELPLT